MLDVANQDLIPENNADPQLKAGHGIQIHLDVSTPTESKYNLALVVNYSTIANKNKSNLDGNIAIVDTCRNCSPHKNFRAHFKFWHSNTFSFNIKR